MIYYKIKLDRKYDIIFLGQTLQKKDNLHHTLGYFHDFVYRENFNKDWRPCGTILVYCRSELQEKISVYDKSSEYINWIKTGKGVSDH